MRSLAVIRLQPLVLASVLYDSEMILIRNGYLLGYAQTKYHMKMELMNVGVLQRRNRRWVSWGRGRRRERSGVFAAWGRV